VRIVAVIPARMASSRFPGKPLAKLHGLPMIEHVFQRVQLCSQLDEVYVATCDKEIQDVAKGFHAKVIMTSAAHERATDRVAEAAEKLEAEIIVMIQGDEPMITPAMIDTALVAIRSESSVSCVNLIRVIETEHEFIDSNTIKVVADSKNNALYFSRSPIPNVNFEQTTTRPFKQVCVIPFRRECLRDFARLPPMPLETAESIDMLRLLEHGRAVRLVETDAPTHSVDTTADLQAVETMLNNDQFMRKYLSERVLEAG
jgi:3-deoxy-manno-octulosonate cytidylyltransferase (CMP-KDO synthetase)